MGTMNKEFEYKGHRFNIKIELGTRVVRCMNGGIYHTATVNDMGQGNYYVSREIDASCVSEEVQKLIQRAKESVDSTERDNSLSIELYDLGFR